MKKQQREALDAYYREGDSWATDRADILRASRRVAWIVASFAVVVALFEAIALIVLMPLKTVVPYTLMVDRNTGFVEALKPLDGDRVSPDKALTQSFLVQYVIARESFDADALQANFRKATLWSADQARSEYIASVQASNPSSPLARLPRTTIIETRVKSISPLGGNSALVRFETQRRDRGGQATGWQPWVSVIRYRFSGEPMQREDRFVNPLGFQVLRYRRDAEALPLPDPAPAMSVNPETSVAAPRQGSANALPLLGTPRQSIPLRSPQFAPRIDGAPR
ncbi:virB8 family protein [Sphingomonas sp. GB1N7]|uniref:virB8 family protein n=1 Tax=Parasphingomonas caseinilytica TaxID=3096158 RepID=UPI002FCABFC5